VSVFSAQDIHAAKVTASENRQRLLLTLQDKSSLAPPEFTQMLGRSFQYPVFDINAIYQLEQAFEVLAFADALKHECIPLRDQHGVLYLVFADPFAEGFSEWAQEKIRQPFELALAHHADIAAYLARFEETLSAMDGVQLGQDSDEPTVTLDVEQLSLKSIAADTSPVVRLVNSTLYDAMKSGASDIHLESTATGLTIRYRIDGVLDDVGAAQGVEMAEQVISRIKVMSELDIAERRIPQDGRFKVLIQKREVDFRVSIMPSVYGEDAVLRVLDRKALTDQSRGLTLENVGLDEATRDQFRKLAREPYGMVLVTGPTGSGKTTTLYAAVTEVNSGRDKIITIEDPVEYHLPGVLQIPVNERKGLTFARGLRSILRHDPDKIMVGEIRDAETAQIAVQAALTGHLVFTTVHANNVFDVIGRFINMEVDAYSFVSALNGILAQRLIRLVCQQCATPVVPDAKSLADSGISTEMASQMKFVVGRGCGHCRGTGYRGRKAVSELLVLNDEMREMIVAREPIRKLKETASRNGLRLLRESALEAVKNGETTLEEINRVTFVD